MKKILTVFTPTFNRAYCLDQLYQSLVRQTNKNFIWLIIDDGSTDNTKKLIDSWNLEAKVDIQYHYQNNLGMHGGHNAAYKLIDTELNVCIDSDDYMPVDAVEKIISFWKSNKNNRYAGFIGLDANKDGEVIGTLIPKHIKETTVTELYQKHKITGDKKLVYRTSVINQYPPYPIFEEEKFVPLGCLYQLIDQDYKILTLNEVLCIVEYMPDGSTLNMLKQYRRHPKGFAYSRLIEIKYATNIIQKFKKATLLISSSLLIKDMKFINSCPNKYLLFLAFPFGVLLYFYIILKTKK